jgi:transposase-like protein
MASVLNEAYFCDEAAAFERLEAIVWPNGPVCPKCGNIGRIYKLEGVRTKPSKKNPEGILRYGLRKCGECRAQFTVRKGTVFEDSPIPLHVWFQAAYLMCSSKKGVSSNQLHRTLGVTLQTAWFMSHRLREAMRDGSLAPMGGAGAIIEIDETAIGRVEGAPKKGKALSGHSHFRNTVLTLVERGGSARSFHVESVRIADLKPIIHANIERETAIMTDEYGAYKDIGKHFASHDTVKHKADEYVRRESGKVVTTNTVEGYYSIFKRGMKGVYQHCKERHLHRYLAEFDFRYSNRVRLGCDDLQRTERALGGIVGKRLTYRDSSMVRV